MHEATCELFNVWRVLVGVGRGGSIGVYLNVVSLVAGAL